MSNNKQQTAVEWFIERLEKKGEAWKDVTYRSINISIDISDYIELKQQAKEMFMEQIEKTYDDGIMKGRQEDGQQYYNETYGGNK
jgi:hypothetical protein